LIKVGERRFRKLIPFVSLFLLAATVFLAFQLKNLRFDYNFEKFYPKDDPDTGYFLELREKFTSDNDFLLLAIPAENGVFDKTFLKRLDSLTKVIEEDSMVTFVMSVTNQEEFFILQGGATASKPYIDFDDYDRERDSIRIYEKQELVNTLVSKKGKTAGLYVKHEEFLSKKKSDRLIESINKKAEELGFDDVHMGGRTIGQKYYIDVMSFEMILFLSMSVILVIIFLVIAFRSVWGVMVPQFVILGGMLWVVGGMGSFHEPLNIILTTLPSIMFVVSMSDTIHLVSRYLDALRTEDSTFDAIKLAVKEVGLATLLTSITTAIGFFTLYFVNVQPIQVFGIVMGIGVLVAFVLTFLMLPILFYFFPGPKYVLQKNKDHFWKSHLERWFLYVIRRPKMIGILGFVIAVVSIIGAVQIKANNYLMDDISPEEKLKQDFNYLDANFGGVRPFIMTVELKDTSQTFWDREVLNELDSVQMYLEDTMGIKVRNSLVSALKIMNRGNNLGKPDYFKLPKSKNRIRSFRRNLRLAQGGKVIQTMMDSTEQLMVINGTLGDIGNIAFQEKMEGLNAFINSRPNKDQFNFKVTGSAYLIDKNISYLAESMVKGLGLSILIVALIIGFVYRSIRVSLISLVPNIFPLIFIAGIMGYFGVELKTSTAIIFTIAFGIAVDDTIHFLGKFKYELMKGKGKMYALKRSYMTTGKAMILTTLILCSGFLLLVMSSFMGTFYMGVLLCATLFVALIADMTLLPVLMMVFYKERKKPE